jgi:hypothetical protein
VGWNGQENHYEKADLIWQAKMAFLELKIVLLHEIADERKPHKERLWER